MTSVEHLLERYSPESSFFFASPTRTLLAQGVREHVTSGDDVTSGRDHPAVVGAVPFDSASPARLLVPEALESAGPLLPLAAPSPTASLRSPCRLRMLPEPREYMRGVERALALMRAAALRKVVLSRALEITLAEPIDLQWLLRRLAQQNPAGYTFAVPLTDSRAGAPQRTLIGASPELLVSRRGPEVVAHPLAGSAARSADPVEDRRRADALLASAKDRHEHAIVVESVAAALRPLCRSLSVPAEPSLTQTPTLWHLSTRISGEVADPSISSLALARALHPTPAVCGDPPELARSAIRSLEPFDRGFFTGAVGYCDAEGDGEWAVSIRCAEVSTDSIRLYAGAGIVAGSDAERELAETSTKLRTMLNALGLDPASEAA